MAVSAKRHLFTVSDYHKMSDAGILRPEDRGELIQGQIAYSVGVARADGAE